MRVCDTRTIPELHALVSGAAFMFLGSFFFPLTFTKVSGYYRISVCHRKPDKGILILDSTPTSIQRQAYFSEAQSPVSVVVIKYVMCQVWYLNHMQNYHF